MEDYSHISSEESSISPLLDVTDLTAHRLRLVFANEATSALNVEDKVNIPARLVLVSEPSNSKETGGVNTATRVWLVGLRPSRVRVKLASVSDSPLVKTALPTSLARLRKQQKQNGAGMWDPQQFQTLWVTVTDNDYVWPVGITAQLVTGIKITSISIMPMTPTIIF